MLNFLIFNGIIFKDDILNEEILYEMNRRDLQSLYSNIKKQALEILEFLLLDFNTLNYDTLKLCLGIIYYLRTKLKILSHWPNKFETLYNLKFTDIEKEVRYIKK
jgi:hypothetical protein